MPLSEWRKLKLVTPAEEELPKVGERRESTYQHFVAICDRVIPGTPTRVEFHFEQQPGHSFLEDIALWRQRPLLPSVSDETKELERLRKLEEAVTRCLADFRGWLVHYETDEKNYAKNEAWLPAGAYQARGQALKQAITRIESALKE